MTRNKMDFEGLVRQFEANQESIDTGVVVLATHLGLGDQISASRVIERLLDRGVEVVLPVKSMYLDFMTKVFGGWQGLSLSTIGNSYNFEFTRISFMANRKGLRVLNLGHGSYPTLRRLFPEYPINSLFNIMAEAPPRDLTSVRLRESLSRLNQIQPPSAPYAFVDQHPGTARKLVGSTLDRLRSEGLEVFNNPREIPLYSTLALMDSATEVHLVPSAPLCMALTADIRSPKRVHHDIYCDPVNLGYSGWTVVSPPGCQTQREFSLSTRAQEVKSKLLSKPFLVG